MCFANRTSREQSTLEIVITLLLALALLSSKVTFSEEGKYNGWYQLYNCIESYFTVRQNIISYYSPVDYEYNSQISKAAQGINDFYDRISARDLSNADKDSIIYIEQLKKQMEDFLTAYCCFSQDDLDSLPEKDTTGIVSLLTRRMLHEE